MKTLELEIALQDGATAVIKGDRIIITIDTLKTKRDLWDTQLEMWLTVKGSIDVLGSGYLRVIKDKLKFVKWK